MIKDIEYNGRSYKVYEPGRIIRSSVNKYRNQLEPEKEDNFFTRSLNNRLFDEYGLSLEDYYIIVALEGRLPTCNSCGRKLIFNNLLNGFNEVCSKCNSVTKTNPVVHYEKGRCIICGEDIEPENSSNKCYKCLGKNFNESELIVKVIDDYLIRYPGKIIKLTHDTYLDQLDGVTKVRYLSKFKSYIKNKYNLSELEYFNLIVYGNINYTHVCENPGCDKLTKFQNLNQGYKTYCSNSCGYESRGDLSSNFKSYYERLNKTVKIKDGKRKKIFTKMTVNEIISLMYHGYKCYSGKYSKKYEKAYLYYTEMHSDSSVFKIGITIDPKDRWSRAKYLSPRVIYEDSVENIAKLEFEIKKQFVHYLMLESDYPTETFSKLNYDEIFEFINKKLIH